MLVALMGVEIADTVAAATPGLSSDRFDAPPPRLAERYEVLGLLGTGGMGAVYRVRDTTLGELVALKVLRAELMHDPDALARFRDEVRLARRVTHRNVARTYDIGEHEGIAFLTMELVEGRSLAGLIAERGAIPDQELVPIACAICAGLSAAHAASIVHRDLKPENVLIAKDGRVVVTDFGIARAHDAAMQATSIVGTPNYMAPEQLEQGAVLDARTDLYALGAVLYEMLTGERAWGTGPVMEVLSARLREREPRHPRVLRPNANETLAAVAMRCMRASADERFASADDVERALRAYQAGPSVVASARPAPRPASSSKTVAVLPFRNAGPPDDDYLASGLTEDFIDTLSMTRGLLVRPRGVVVRFEKSPLGPHEIGRELGVQVIVDGSIRRVGTTVQLGVRLIGTADGFQLWAKRFEASINDLLVVSDGAARAIADALTTELPVLDRSAQTDPAGVELYLRARAQFLSSWRNTAAPAAKLFESALALAPSDPRIVAGCALAYVRMIFFGEGDRAANVARARELTERAVVLGPELGDAWASLASFRLHTSDAVGAMRAARAGLDHAPNSAALHDLMGRLLVEVGRADEALVRLEIALALDPTLFTARLEISRVHALLGDWSSAEAVLEGPTPIVGAHDAQRARLAFWRQVELQGLRLEPNTYAQIYCDVLRTRTLSPEVRKFMIDRAASSTGRLRALFYQRNTEIFAFIGDVDEAIAATQSAIAGDLLDVLWMDRCPVLESVRADPRWPALRAVVAERGRRILEAMSSNG